MQEHGHANVPWGWAPNPALAQWVVTQRQRWRGMRYKPLTASQQSRLEACGCVPKGQAQRLLETVAEAVVS